MISFNYVTKTYGNGFPALRQVNFELGDGEMAFLTGHSGAGKSTLLKIILLMERCSSGQVIVNHMPLDKIKGRDVAYFRRSIGVILQDPYLLPNSTVHKNVALPLVFSGCRHQDIASRVRAALDKVGLLSKEKMPIETLSQGEQERVSIARAIVHKPKLLLADEPTGNLDPVLSAEIMHLFEQFNQMGVTVLIATHDLGLIGHLRHRILTLHQGRMVSTGVRMTAHEEALC